jgi:hypothetical protein
LWYISEIRNGGNYQTLMVLSEVRKYFPVMFQKLKSGKMLLTRSKKVLITILFLMTMAESGKNVKNRLIAKK